MLCVRVMPQKRLEELRELNRETFKATGEYMTEVRQLKQKGAQSLNDRFWVGAAGGTDSGVLLCAGGNCKVPTATLDRPQVRPDVFSFHMGFPSSFAMTSIHYISSCH